MDHRGDPPAAASRTGIVIGRGCSREIHRIAPTVRTPRGEERASSAAPSDAPDVCEEANTAAASRTFMLRGEDMLRFFTLRFPCDSFAVGDFDEAWLKSDAGRRLVGRGDVAVAELKLIFPPNAPRQGFGRISFMRRKEEEEEEEEEEEDEEAVERMRMKRKRRMWDPARW